MQGAPQVSDDNAEGQVAALLKAVLVDGFGALAPDSIAWDATESAVKMSFSGGHAYEVDSVLLVEGVTPSDYNGEHRILKVATTDIWVEYDDGVEPINATVLGSVKVAPLGWTLTHSDGNDEVLIFNHTGDLGNVSLRIDNSAYSGWSGSYARHCKVAMVENIVDINTYDKIYENAWPATDRYSTGGWDLVGDNRIFYYMTRYGTKNNFGGFVAGYIDTIRAGDRYHFIMNSLEATDSDDSTSGRWDQLNSSAYNYYTNFTSNNNTTQNRIARKYHQLEGSDSWKKRGIGSYGSDVMILPNPADNGFYINAQPQMIQESDNTYRGTLPIMIEPLANNDSLYRKNLKDLPEHDGKIFRFLFSTYSNLSDYSHSLCGFDISTVEG